MPNEPATKQDIQEAEQRTAERMDRMRDELVEKMRDMQTEVLRAFHNWARPIEIRLRHADEIAQRISMLEDRISALERGDTPPHQKDSA